ncbi:MAG: hypothetical protein C5B51_15820 [Terriglobia bacterium]|nr:MAG: hypothetical protein C5B51_15820 [Terriglobia bacterium]
MWAFAAVLAAAIAIFCFNLRSDTTSYIAGVAASQLTNGQVDFRSADPVEIRAWIKANAGFDVPLPAQHSAELAGVSLIRGLACVSYRIGNHEARLIVAPGGAAPPHHSMQSVVYAGAALSSWAMQGQTYALAAASQDLRAACVLCHAEGPARPRG